MSDYRDYKDQRREERRERREWARERWESRVDKGQGHVWTGLFLLVIGGVALIKSFGFPVPVWLFSWQMLLITIGLFIGLRKGFRDGGWFVPIIIGSAFLVNEYVVDGDLRKHMWPLILIVVGAIFLLRPRRKHLAFEQKKNAAMNAETITPVDEQQYTQDDIIDSTCIFSGTKKVILSKNFKGGEMTNIFGGAEIDFTQADINGTAVLDVTAIFGGATLVVPSNWAVRSECVTIFGGVGDKRKFAPYNETTNKTLIIKGTLMFGGLEIKSY